GGTATGAAFTLSATGPTPISGAGGASSGSNFAAGTYTLSETGLTGYAAGPWVCTGGTQTGTQITLGVGQSATCNIANSDIQPKLTVVKTVNNTNGGTAVSSNFTMTVTGNSVTPSSSFPGSAGGTTVVLNAGGYSVGESGPAGYAGTYSADCSGTIGFGQTKTCTVSNQDQAGTINGVAAVGGNNWSGSSTTKSLLGGGAYNVSENPASGYTASFSPDCSSSISIGQTKTCTITNQDQPGTLTVFKHVNNTYGGTAAAGNFTMVVNAGHPSNNNFPGSEAGIQ